MLICISSELYFIMFQLQDIFSSLKIHLSSFSTWWFLQMTQHGWDEKFVSVGNVGRQTCESMLKLMLNYNRAGKSVLNAGCTRVVRIRRWQVCNQKLLVFLFPLSPCQRAFLLERQVFTLWQESGLKKVCIAPNQPDTFCHFQRLHNKMNAFHSSPTPGRSQFFCVQETLTHICAQWDCRGVKNSLSLLPSSCPHSSWLALRLMSLHLHCRMYHSGKHFQQSSRLGSSLTSSITFLRSPRCSQAAQPGWKMTPCHSECQLAGWREQPAEQLLNTIYENMKMTDKAACVLNS